MRWHRELLISILHSRISVAEALNVQIVSLQQAPDAYARFNAGEPVKFIIDPRGLLSSITASAHAAAHDEQKREHNSQ